MKIAKDYYKILGVLNDAEIVVIHAAYRALSQRYEIGRWKGDKLEANNRLHEINEAFVILSDPVKREQYDESLDKLDYESTKDDDVKGTNSEEIDKDWELACVYHPKLRQLHASLGQISSRLSFTYKMLMLSSKNYDRAEAIATDLEQEFLKKYFGKNQTIIHFAKELIIGKERDAVAELHNISRILGDHINGADVIEGISKKFETLRYREKLREVERAKKDLAYSDAMEEERRIERDLKLKREAQINESNSKFQVRLLIAVVILFVGVYYFFGRSESESLKVSLTPAANAVNSVNSENSNDQQKSNVVYPQNFPETETRGDCSLILSSWRKSVRGRELDAAKGYELKFNKCAGVVSNLTEKIDLENVFSEDLNRAYSLETQKKLMFPSGAKVNARAAQLVTVAWQIVMLENDIATNNERSNFAAAMRLNKEAYAAGHPESASNIGYMHQYGLGVTRDLDEAIFWYGKAIKMGAPHSAQAEFQLAKIFHTGEGIYSDPGLAEKFYQAVIDAAKGRDYVEIAKARVAESQAGLAALR